MTHIHTLHTQFLQSPWLDNLSRDLVHSGQLQSYIDQGIRGVTSNPTILEHAITTSTTYNEQIRQLAARGLDDESIFLHIAIDDIKAAAVLLEPIWHTSNGLDGYVSLEVSPRLAHDTAKTIEQAKWLWQEVNMPNLMIKIPATTAGIPAIQEVLGLGINVNVTLLFSLERYKQVVDAFAAAHHTKSGAQTRSVASFFVSRVDTEIDNRLEAIGTTAALDLRGRSAIAQALLAYDIFLNTFASTITLEGANSPLVQRLLWASTSTKNPNYDDLLYVTSLIAPHTVNTLPEDTISKIIDHLPSDARRVSVDDIESARQTFLQLESVGINLANVAQVLESQGVQKFQDSFASLLAAIASKRS